MTGNHQQNNRALLGDVILDHIPYELNLARVFALCHIDDDSCMRTFSSSSARVESTSVHPYLGDQQNLGRPAPLQTGRPPRCYW
jgi:hypothetical protein